MMTNQWVDGFGVRRLWVKRKSKSIASGLLTLTCLLLFVTSTDAQVADSLHSAELGKDLFEKEWEYDPPEFPVQGNLSKQEYLTLLRTLPGDGLGPMYNAKSCEACHAVGGASGVDRNVTMMTLDPRSIKNNPLARGDENQRRQFVKNLDSLFPGFVGLSGGLTMDVVVHEESARDFFSHLRERVREGVPGGVADEWFDRKKRTSAAIASQPVVAGRHVDIDYYLSQRNSPPLFGLGVVNKIERSRLQLIAHYQKKRSSGKITGRLGTGKFGWRAQTTSLQAFVMGACAGELGLQVNESTPQAADLADETYLSLGTDLDQFEFMNLVSYVSSLPVPTQQRTEGDDWAGARAGKKLFGKIGCNACHVENVYPARGIFSDLLLHDMGHHLQAPSPAPIGTLTGIRRMRLTRLPAKSQIAPRSFGSSSTMGYYGGSSFPEPYVFNRTLEPRFPVGELREEELSTKDQRRITWEVLQREWRTPPLWGVADSGPYLHDGRATTLDAAIRWHGGEASETVQAYRSLSKSERKYIITFLKTLRAPLVPDENHKDVGSEWIDSLAEGDASDKDADSETKDLVSIFARGY